jgi:putative heme-binding domain-containing protein
MDVFCVLGLSLLATGTHGQPPDPYSQLIAATQPLPASEQQKKFHLPAGFIIELVATEPKILKPMNLNFDAKGRLYVTGSVEYPFPAKENSTPRDALHVLEDADRDGAFERVKTFADKLNIPIGVVPVANAVMAYSIPNIYRFVDTQDDGVADQRKVAYQSIGYRDTHGMASSFYWWVDGWVYGCHGFANESKVHGSDGRAITMRSGNTYRMRPDGSHIEHFTFGQVNPFGLCFDPLGNVYTADCHSSPAYLLIRGARYPHFADPDDGLGFPPRLMDHSHGSTGIAGIVFYAAEAFPTEYRGTLFIGNPVTGRINHDRLEPRGSGYRAIEQPDFLRCDDPWFRPVDIKLGPDGALYIADFYNRIIGHYEVPLTHPGRDRERGRIWRVRYVGQRSAGRYDPGPDLTRASADELIEFLKDPNLTVRVLATHQLVERIGPRIADRIRQLLHTANEATADNQSRPHDRLGDGPSLARQKVHALWVLQRLGRLEEATIAALAEHTDRMIRVHALRSAAERDWGPERSNLHQLVLTKLADADPVVRRVAADSLGRHAYPENVKALLDFWSRSDPSDAHLVYTTRLALRDTIRTLGVDAAVAPFRTDPNRLRSLAEVSLGIPTAQSARFVLTQLEAENTETARFDEQLYHVARYADRNDAARVLSFAQRFTSAEPARQRAVLQALQRAAEARGEKLAEPAVRWAVRLAREMLAKAKEEDVRSGLELARQIRLAELADELVQWSAASARIATLRPNAIDALVAVSPGRSIHVLASILADAREPLELRRKSAEALAAVNNAESRGVLERQIRTAPAPLDLAIAHGLALSPDGAETLLRLVAEGRASRSLLQDWVVAIRLQSYGKPQWERQRADLTKDLPPQSEQVTRALVARRDRFASAITNSARGAEVFTKHCGICHQLANRGSKVGPQLDGIGVRGLERLLEDVFDPNRNVEQAFRASVLALNDGRVVTGLVLREEGQTVVLVDNQGKEIRIPTSQIDQRRLSPLSPMPTDVVEKLSEQDLFDLLAFLLEQRQPPATAP